MSSALCDPSGRNIVQTVRAWPLSNARQLEGYGDAVDTLFDVWNMTSVSLSLCVSPVGSITFDDNAVLVTCLAVLAAKVTAKPTRKPSRR